MMGIRVGLVEIPLTATTGSGEVLIASSSTHQEEIQDLASLMTSASVGFKKLCLDMEMLISRSRGTYLIVLSCGFVQP